MTRQGLSAGVLLIAFLFFLPCPLPAQFSDKKQAVSGVLLSVNRVKQSRQITIDPYRGAMASVLDSLLESTNEYLVVVQVGDKSCAGRVVLPTVANAGRHTPAKWPANSLVQVRFKKGGKTKVRMYVRGPSGKEVRTELVSVLAADGREKCQVQKDKRNCADAWNQK